ncbi:MAG TPA: DUF3891 family protein [Conexibacter sp.]|nr:DUF3891 family protein [Conexibacter sp.]
MLVRDAGDAWQIVLQPDHADLSAQLAAAWGGPGFARPEPFDSVVRAAQRHDDGWAAWERCPRIGADGAPQSFFAVPAPVHLAFYRAGVEVVCDEDPYAGLLVSMHMSGLYRARYGAMPTPPMQLADEVRPLVDAFVAAEEERQTVLASELEVDEAWQWRNYALLQVVDVVSLYCGLADLEVGAEGGVEGVPTDDGEPTRIAIQPLGPWRVRFDPYPFVEDTTPLTLVRRLVPKRAWADDDAFRADLAATPAETVRIYAQR